MKLLIILMVCFIVLNAASAVNLFSRGKDIAEETDAKSKYNAKIFFASAVVKMIEAITLTIAIKQLR